MYRLVCIPVFAIGHSLSERAAYNRRCAYQKDEGGAEGESMISVGETGEMTTKRPAKGKKRRKKKKNNETLPRRLSRTPQSERFYLNDGGHSTGQMDCKRSAMPAMTMHRQ